MLAPVTSESTVLLFAPETDWAPTFFRALGPHQGVRVASKQEMLAVGLYRFGIPARELTLLSQLEPHHLRAVEPLLDALAAAGVAPTGWRAMTQPRSTLDAVSDVFRLGRWRRITAARRFSGGLEVLSDVPVLPVSVRRRPRP